MLQQSCNEPKRHEPPVEQAQACCAMVLVSLNPLPKMKIPGSGPITRVKPT